MFLFQFTITSSIIDICFVTVTNVIKQNKNFISTYHSCVLLLESLLKYRKALITDRLPSYLQQYRNLLGVLCKNGDSELKLNLVEVQQVSDCAHQFEKLTNNLTTYGKHVMRISPYLIADILQQYETVTLYPNIKVIITLRVKETKFHFSFISVTSQQLFIQFNIIM